MSSKRILVVDDSTEVRDFLANTLLSPQGYGVAMARDGEEGLAAAHEAPPDLIITDQAMPGLTGLEMLAALRASGVDAPVILMTAEGSEEIAAQALRDGVSYYFTKPFDTSEMLEAVQALLEGAPQAEELQEAGGADWSGAQALSVLDSFDDGLIVVDGGGNVSFVNHAATPFLKKTARQNAVGRKVAGAIGNGTLISLLTNNSPSEEVEMPTDDGRVYAVRVRRVEGVGRMAVLHDISRQKDVDEKRNEFVSTVAHDLRSPLTGILSYLELTERVHQLTPQQVTYTNAMRQAVVRMTSLLNDLLDLSRIEAGKEKAGEPVSLASTARQCVDALRARAESKGLILSLEGGAEPMMVAGNPHRLMQVFTNLVENAIKYTPQGGTIRITLSGVAGQAMISVTDSGIGISQKDLPHVFDKFYRVPEIASDYEGTGLGLSIAKSIVEAYSGRIWVDSTPGQGSTFTVVLPFHEILA